MIWMLSITEANQNFSKVTRLVDERGSAVILKNNVPRYLVVDFSKADESAVASDEDIVAVSKRLLAKNKEAYEVQSAPYHPNPGKDIILTLCYNIREGRESKI